MMLPEAACHVTAALNPNGLREYSVGVSAFANPRDPFLAERTDMVEKQLRARGIHDERVLAAMARVPRHEFVQQHQQREAYDDRPLLIGEQQTISQPYMVATQLEAAHIQPADVVLEVGTGSGYQTALLAELAAEVFSVERFPSLAGMAQWRLAHLHYSNVVVVVGDGSLGYPQCAPYDAIIVSAASPRVPPALVEQLRDGGRLLVPVGGADEQVLHLVTKVDNSVQDRALFPCKFVPLVGTQGFTR
jgi:protein-L-isoaspartate(D-aspartate) O-methyltransferase